MTFRHLELQWEDPLQVGSLHSGDSRQEKSEQLIRRGKPQSVTVRMERRWVWKMLGTYMFC